MLSLIFAVLGNHPCLAQPADQEGPHNLRWMYRGEFAPSRNMTALARILALSWDARALYLPVSRKGKEARVGFLSLPPIERWESLPRWETLGRTKRNLASSHRQTNALRTLSEVQLFSIVPSCYSFAAFSLTKFWVWWGEYGISWRSHAWFCQNLDQRADAIFCSDYFKIRIHFLDNQMCEVWKEKKCLN